MTMRDLYCIACGKALTNGLDTFGLPNEEMCWNCHSAWLPGAPEHKESFRILSIEELASLLLTAQEEQS